MPHRWVPSAPMKRSGLGRARVGQAIMPMAWLMRQAVAPTIRPCIRALGAWAPGSYSDYARLSSVKEAVGTPSADEMVAELAADQATVVRTAREVLPIAEKAGDQPTVDLLSARMEVHEKNAWMLRSLLEE